MGGGVVKDEEYYRAQFLKLGPRSFFGALAVAKRAGLCHCWYQHYMSLTNLKKMVDKRNGMIWLSRLDSKALNDWNEGMKYGSRAGCRRLYVWCMSYGGSENAAMWKMYCKPNARAVRIMINQAGVRLWAKCLARPSSIDAKWIVDGHESAACKSIKRAGIGDVLYASVKKSGLDSERYNALSWNGAIKKKEDLQAWSRSDNVEGFLKDCEWSYENETRLFVHVHRENKNAERLAIRVPGGVFDHMSIVLSPWMDEMDAKRTAKRLQELFVANGYKRPYIRQSFLKGALESWQ